MYYFAYGSNMNWPQMKRRCPSSKFICVARLADYQFGITRHSRLRDCGTANVFPVVGMEVWGVVYEVSDSELLILDSFEDGYRRAILPVYAFGDGVQPLEALIYIAEIEGQWTPGGWREQAGFRVKAQLAAALRERAAILIQVLEIARIDGHRIGPDRLQKKRIAVRERYRQARSRNVKLCAATPRAQAFIICWR